MPDPLPIQHMHHIALATKQHEVTADFYRNVLGFRDLRRPAFDFPGGWLYGYHMQIHLIDPLDREEAQKPPGLGLPIDPRANHLAFAIEDASRVTSLLEEHGVSYRENKNAAGIHQIFFRDPDGNHIEVAVYPHPAVELVPEVDGTE